MAEPPDLERPLRALLAEIAIGHYRDQLGQRLTLNTAYLEAWAALELIDTLEHRAPPRRSAGDGPEER